MLTLHSGRRTRGRTVSTLTALTLGASLTLTGCFGNPLDALTGQDGPGGLEGIIDEATGGILDGFSGGLPEGFPTEVPLIEGDVQGGFGMNVDDGSAWTVVVKVTAGSVTEAAKHIASQMEMAGFETTDAEGEFAGQSVRTYSKDKLGALVTVVGDDSGEVTATYIVTREK